MCVYIAHYMELLTKKEYNETRDKRKNYTFSSSCYLLECVNSTHMTKNIVTDNKLQTIVTLAKVKVVKHFRCKSIDHMCFDVLFSLLFFLLLLWMIAFRIYYTLAYVHEQFLNVHLFIQMQITHTPAVPV